jgi:hypothetical protein
VYRNLRADHIRDAVKARIFFVALLVALWTRITPRPPHRSRRAPLTQAPPSGFGVEAVTGQRVECLDWGKEAIDEADEALPGEVSLLASSPKRSAPHQIAKTTRCSGGFRHTSSSPCRSRTLQKPRPASQRKRHEVRLHREAAGDLVIEAAISRWPQPPKTGNCGQGHVRPLRPYTLP